MKNLLFLALFFICGTLSLHSFSQSFPQKGFIPFDFVYKQNNQKAVLNLDVYHNATNYSKIMNYLRIPENRNDVLYGRKYISLVSCIRRREIGDMRAIDRASEQASVIRAMFKSKLDIPHDCISFSIDTTQDINNRVLVNVFDGELPHGNASNNIEYTYGKGYSRSYPNGIPYCNMWMILYKYQKNL